MGAAMRDLQVLCERWREDGSSGRDDREALAEQFLQWFGWKEPAPVACPGSIGDHCRASYLLRQPAHGAIVAYFVGDGLLKSPALTAEASLDFCLATRLLVNITKAMNARYAFITDMYAAYFYDVQTDELLLTADAPDAFAEVFSEALGRKRLQEGGLEDLRRTPRSQTARELRDWQQRWQQVLQLEWRLPEEQAWLAMDRLTLLRFMAERDVLRRPGWHVRTAFAELLAGAGNPEYAEPGKALTMLWREVWKHWRNSLFKPQGKLEAVCEQDELARPMLREFYLLSRTKFQLGTILESFNYGEAAEKARVRMIPEENEERTYYLAGQTPETADELQVRLDLDSEGYRAIFYWFDQVMAAYERLSAEAEQQEGRAQPEAPQDLFAWSEANAKRPRAFRDPYQQAVEHGVILFYSSPRQLRTARLMLNLHLIERYRSARTRILRFPKMEAALQPRPKVVEREQLNTKAPRKKLGMIVDGDIEAM